MIKEEKKKYPSELNTKSIACRIPMGDYVEIMNECVNKGISVNDWLLLKLYRKEGIGLLEVDNETNENNEFPEFTIQTPRGEYTFQDIDDIENTVNHLIQENSVLQKKIYEYSIKSIRDIDRVIDVDDINQRNKIYMALIDKINGIEWETNSDKISFRKEFKSIWKELFD
jgi:hypothetical protein